MWTDRPLFQSAVNLAFGALGHKVTQEFIDDRSSLRGGRFDVAKMRAAIPQMRDQIRAYLGWIDAQLSDGRAWLLGDFSLADVSAYMNVWYVRSSLASPEDQAVAGLDKVFASLPRVAEWESPIEMAFAKLKALFARPRRPNNPQPLASHRRRPSPLHAQRMRNLSRRRSLRCDMSGNWPSAACHHDGLRFTRRASSRCAARVTWSFSRAMIPV